MVGTGVFTDNIGVGTTSPSEKLHVTGNGLFSGNLTTMGRLLVGLGSAANPPISFQGDPDTGLFRVNVDMLGFSTAGTTRMVLTSAGRLGIGTTGPDQLLTVNGNASKSGGGSWAVFSDERLKRINGEFTRGLPEVMQLQPIRYQYKADNAMGIVATEEQIGFGARAVGKVIPEAVMSNERGYLLVNNDPIMWTMLNAIKEQQTQIQTQEKTIQRQQTELEALKKLVCPQNLQAELCQAK